MTCLSVSTDGSLLLSGSHDETVRLWDIQSKQCLKTMNHKGRNVLISRILTARGCCCLTSAALGTPGAFLPLASRPGKGRGVGGSLGCLEWCRDLAPWVNNPLCTVRSESWISPCH